MASPKTIARLEAQIQRRAAHCLQHEVADPRMAFVTITKVELSSDIAVAKIGYSVLGNESDRSQVEHLLKHAGGFIRRQVASILRTRSAPELRWEYDSSIEDAARMDQRIQEIRDRDRAINPAVDEPEVANDMSGEDEEE